MITRQWLSYLPKIQTTSFQYRHLRVMHYGDGLAVVSSIFVVDAMIDGSKFEPKTQSSTYGRNAPAGGRWSRATPCDQKS